MTGHLKDITKVAAAASTNVVAAGARAATDPGVQTVVQHGNPALHNTLLIIQIIVGVLSAAYIGFKLWRAWREKKPLGGSPTA
jgi:hypothetical protein